MGEIAVRVEKLKKYFGTNRVIDGIDLEIKTGEIFGVIGTSGSGKSTFLNTLIGFLQPDSGKVLFQIGDKLLSVTENPSEVKKKYGFAAQLPSFYEKLTVVENLDYFGSLYNLSKEARTSNMNTLLELVDLDHARHLQAKNLSGGMQRRLDMACALVHNPDILILDEPTSDLDMILAKQIWDLIRKINRKGTTIIVASHDLPEIESICTRIGLLSEGKLRHMGTVNDLKSTLSKGQEIHVETYPGDYDAVIKNMKDPQIMDMENRGSMLVIHTKRPDKVLGRLLIVLSKLDETLLDVKITKLNLKDVFTKITAKNGQDNTKEH